ncbi:germination protein YpeB [Anaerotruncus rubiinfantis]|uniref:germination protein YpeB n=2 Tax=Anaerotruncus rubiinfantis TaxID=1720200 RepID=UPI0034A53323
MELFIERRVLVRVISYTAAGMLTLGGVAWQQNAAAADYRGQLENTYERSLGELSSYLTNISTDLDKGQYIGTGGQLAQMSARIWRESGGAKSALSTLPVSDLHMDATYKFLSQVGDYAMALSKKVASGGALSEEEKENAQALRRYALSLTEYIDILQQRVRDGAIEVSAMRTSQGDGTEGTIPRSLSAGFEDIEQTMTGYPTLIYDGPFSDHLLTQRPKLTRGLAAVTPEQALQIAARAAMVNPGDLTRADDENSNMPCYTFQKGSINAAVTKAGGLTAYMVNSRDVNEERINKASIFENAGRYLERMGLQNLRATYYETIDGVCTINYAAMNGDITLYTDLVKVGIALDDGGTVFFDARGYINNHYDRAITPPALTAEQAQASVNPDLAVLSNRLALIPTSGKGEVLTYEFLTTAPDGEKLLIYVNAQNGAEEQILLLLETPYGTLTK